MTNLDKMKRESMRISFEGQSHQIDANTLINVLTHYSMIISETNKELGYGKDISLKINALEKGSFVIDITLVEKGLESLFCSNNIHYLKDFVEAIGAIFAVYKICKGKPAKESDTTININGNINIDRSTIINIYNKIISIKDSISEKIQYFNENINTEDNRLLLKFLISQIKIVLKHIAPRKYKICIKYGAGEPDVTGKVISYVAIANAFFNLNLNFVPIFDEQVLEGEIYLRGRIRAFTMLIIAFRIYRNKQFKKMIKKFK